ncbi:hypothetical protein BH24GEM3_BH24GEM3_05810 [soil metagenome]
MELRSALLSAVLLGSLIGAGAATLGSKQLPLGFFSRSAPLVLDLEVDAEDAVSWDLPVVWNEPVAKFVNLFGGRQTSRMALYLQRSGRYEAMIRGKLREQGMPEDLLYLSMIESGFNPDARSPAHAVGLWQFIAETGRRYGLRIDSYVDERRDPEKSTDAALKYLRYLHNRFDSWYLAAAAYNTGENRVGRIMREMTGAEKGEEAYFWRIRHRLPSETRDYVPLVVAAALVGKEPHKYGLENVERWTPVPTETVAVPGGSDLTIVASAVGATGKELRALNPQLIRGMTPPGGSYRVRIPEGRGSLYAANFSRVRAEALAQAEVRKAQERRVAQAKAKSQPKAKAKPTRTAPSRVHRVKNGESLSVIAQRHRTSVGAIQRANGLGKRTSIRAGQTLRIPS